LYRQLLCGRWWCLLQNFCPFSRGRSQEMI
jgi:hypothetical protein